MSQKVSQVSILSDPFDLLPFQHYFIRFVRHKLKGISTLQVDHNCSPTIFTLVAAVPQQVSATNIDEALTNTQVKLVLFLNKQLLHLQQFEVSNQIVKLVTGMELLNHYGKKPAVYSLKDVQKNTWTMSCARNLQALFEAYDNLALEWNMPPVFGHKS